MAVVAAVAVVMAVVVVVPMAVAVAVVVPQSGLMFNSKSCLQNQIEKTLRIYEKANRKKAVSRQLNGVKFP